MYRPKDIGDNRRGHEYCGQQERPKIRELTRKETRNTVDKKREQKEVKFTILISHTNLPVDDADGRC
uniref:Uncharacterized protein n=1 Tax=Onchocerca volvulus TaxID=6282 RepID=A0A8R1XYT8_ONCVO